MLTLYDIILAAEADPLRADIISASVGLVLCIICFAVEIPFAKVSYLPISDSSRVPVRPAHV